MSGTNTKFQKKILKNKAILSETEVVKIIAVKASRATVDYFINKYNISAYTHTVKIRQSATVFSLQFARK